MRREELETLSRVFELNSDQRLYLLMLAVSHPEAPVLDLLDIVMEVTSSRGTKKAKKVKKKKLSSFVD